MPKTLRVTIDDEEVVETETVILATGASAQEISVSGGGPGDADVYVAEEGDTLWDISDRFFHDPSYWPVLWSFNPHITNPKWIFPGDQV